LGVAVIAAWRFGAGPVRRDFAWGDKRERRLLSSSFGAAGLGPHVCCIVVEKNLSKLSQNKTINSTSKRDCMPFSSNDPINTKTLKFAKDIRN
jgi:hypothetical protein